MHSVEQRIVDQITKDVVKLLTDYEYEYPDYAFEFVEKSLDATESLRVILRQHPNWNEERQYISFSADTERKVDPQRMRDFCDYYYRREEYGSTDLEQRRWGLMRRIVRKSTIENEGTQFPDDELVELVNEFLKTFDRGHITKQTKISKIINKCGKLLGMNNHVDIREVGHWDDEGNYISKKKDFGWNYQFAQFADGINPINIKRHTIISINPIDYLTMSIGDNWNSCHSIKNPSDPGCYSSGTISYALDETTIIFYYVDNSYEEDEYFSFLPKQKRCAFYLGEDKLIQSRVYPDGRDGGDCGLAEEVRNIMQKVIADCLDIPNLWTLVKGKETATEMIDTYGTHYPDYTYYNDVTTSFRLVNGEKNLTKIRVGHEPFCMRCGNYYDRGDHEHIYCPDCKEDYEYHCECCGDGFDSDVDDAVYVRGEGWMFCCSRCAERRDYVYCEDIEEWEYIDYAYLDEYTGNYFACDGEMIKSFEGYYYQDEYNAEADGNRYCEDIGEWSNDYFQDDYDGNYYHNTDYMVETSRGYKYYNEVHAEEDGCHYCEDTETWEYADDCYYDDCDGLWYHDTDEMVEVNGDTFHNAENAREAGYEIYRGEWMDVDEIEEILGREVA